MKTIHRLIHAAIVFSCTNISNTNPSRALADSQFSIDVEINNTSTPSDDYLTWAPTPARIKLSATSKNETVKVILANRPDVASLGGKPLHGKVAFATSIMAGQTATSETLNLDLPADGSWVPFFVAGSFPHASSADKDAVIETHLTDPAGRVIGSHAMMVRVRKNVDRLSLEERDAFLKALHDLHMEEKGFETFPQMHDLASKGKSPYQPIFLPDGSANPKYWPDQAHQGSAFLPWHRAFLLLLERKLQAINPAVTIPYWRQNAATEAFDPMFLGTNRRAVDTFQTEVIFSPANWLYGWSIAYNDLKTVVRAPKDTSLLHRANGMTLIGDSELFGATPLYPNFGQFHSQLETDPHNRGHALLGAWHANCLISPADPSFWPFHAEDDRLWAYWQWFHGRFNADGSSAESYDYSGTFKPDDIATTTLGHNLNDTMWPWDGSKGRVISDSKSRGNRPDQNPFPRFPRAGAAGLWPASDAMPTPADMIDYLGLSSSRLPHGVAYDDVPYGVRSTAVSAVAPTTLQSTFPSLADTAKDNSAPLDKRQAALAMLRNSGHPHPEEIFSSVAADASTPAQIRQLAATNLIDINPTAGLRAVLAIIDQGADKDGSLTAAVIETSSLTHREILSEAVGSRVHHLVTQVAADLNNPNAATAAIALAEMGDSKAPKYLFDLINSGKIKEAVKARVVTALSLTASNKAPALGDILEKALRDNDTETALAALRVLAGDQSSRSRRLKLVEADDNVDPLINRAAMKSVMHETIDLLPKLLVYLEGPLPPAEGRKLEAAGAFRVAVESLKPFPSPQVDEWKRRITTVRDAAGGGDVEFKRALTMTLQILQDAAN